MGRRWLLMEGSVFSCESGSLSAEDTITSELRLGKLKLVRAQRRKQLEAG
jgi:hypothetical protein